MHCRLTTIDVRPSDIRRPTDDERIFPFKTQKQFPRTLTKTWYAEPHSAALKYFFRTSKRPGQRVFAHSKRHGEPRELDEFKSNCVKDTLRYPLHRSERDKFCKLVLDKLRVTNITLTLYEIWKIYQSSATYMVSLQVYWLLLEHRSMLKIMSIYGV